MNRRHSFLAYIVASRARAVCRSAVTLLIIHYLLSGCAQVNPAPRDQLVENLAPIRKIEAEASKLTFVYQKLAVSGFVNNVDQEKIREYYDVYYIYHKAAAVSLAEGDVESYKSYVDLAGEELDRIEAKMKFLVQLTPD